MDASPVAAVVGASDGIGLGLSRALVALGWRVLLAARRGDALAAAVASLPAGRAASVVVDASSPGGAEAAAAAAEAAFGRLDAFVNCVGRGISKSVLACDADDVSAMVSANILPALFGMQAAARRFTAARRGHIVNVSSLLGKVPALAPPRALYSACKSALNALSSALRAELAAGGRDHRVFCTTVLPGVVHTAFAANALAAPPGASSAAMPGQSVEEAVAPIAALMAAVFAGAEPPAELYTQGAPQHDMALRYAADVAAFEKVRP